MTSEVKPLPLVSVITPAYNAEPYIAETLDSVLASTYSNIEVIVVDDGSSDGTVRIANEYAARDSRVRVYEQKHGGVCNARNFAIEQSKGELILPVDSDDLITPDFIADAVDVILSDDDVKVVCPQAEYIGERSGKWNLPAFDINLLARKNILCATALYRKSDWEKTGGYNRELSAREDWDFWISMLKNGGKVKTLPKVSFYYRIKSGSKRVTDRKLKAKVVDELNKRHPEFLERELGGKLRYMRSHSKMINRIYRLFHKRSVYVNPRYSQIKEYMTVLPVHWSNGEGKVIYKGRNELREVTVGGVTMVIKEFTTPNWINQVSYGIFRKSKAYRSYKYAQMLLANGIGTPEPVAYYTERDGLLFRRSYYACLKSECPNSYIDLMDGKFPNQERILRAIARVAARMHDLGYLHKDFSRGNILFKDTAEDVKVEIIDLNRIRFRKIDMLEGCKNFERLPGTPEMLRIMADEYAKARGFDADKCFEIMATYREAARTK